MARIKFTTSAKLFGVKTEGFPVILREDLSVDRISLEYFFHLHRYAKTSSLKTYAGHICDFISQLEIEPDRSIDTIDDDWLFNYKNMLLQRRNDSGRENSENYCSQIIATILRYLLWLEESKFTHNLIGISKLNQIIIKLDDGKLTHPLTKFKRSKVRTRPTPRNEWIDIIKKYGKKSIELDMQYKLMIDWCVVLGLRAMEVCSLKLSNIPSRGSIIKAIDGEYFSEVFLETTKGDQPGPLPVSSELIARTWDFIEIYRPVINKKSKSSITRRVSRNEESDYVFISSKTASRFNSRSFSNSIRSGFLHAVKAGELEESELVWCHGLKATFTSNLLKKFDEANLKNREETAIRFTRHSNIETMKHYVPERIAGVVHGKKAK